MPGYLEAYGAGDEKRERLLRRTAIVVAVVLAIGGAFYFFFRNYRETKQAKLFFEFLGSQNYRAAYALWGCTDVTPCRHYPFEKFMEDWGPKSDHANVAALEITKTRGCSDGVIIEANFGQGLIEYLWVDRAHRNVGFAPQYVEGMMPVCNPVYRPGASATVSP